ncbi:hypothetical protein V2J09_020530 [Rumex salicifolius]
MNPAKKEVKILSRKTMSRRRDGEDESGEGSSSHREFEVEPLPKERLKGVSRFNQLQNELATGLDRRDWVMSRYGFISGFRSCVIHPDSTWYRIWVKIIVVWALYSSFFTPFEFGFFKGLPKKLFILDMIGQVAFLIDIVLQFFVAYRDDQTYRMVHQNTTIALRYLKSSFAMDLLACMPWIQFYKVQMAGHKEVVRCLIWIRLIRVRKVLAYFKRMEKDIRISYLFTRIVKLLFVELYCTHTAACIFYYLATTLPEEQEGYTWIGSLKLGEFSYARFREIDLWTRYTTSLYFSIVTMATVGYGDIHAVNLREMIFIMIYVSFDMVLGAYLIGNMTAIIVKGSKTEKFRDKMTEVMKYMNRNRLGRDLRAQIKGHLLLQHESSDMDATNLRDIPISLRAKISRSLYMSHIKKVSLFRGCSDEFINQIVIRLHEEFFLPGEVILEQGYVVDQLYFVCDGKLEELGVTNDGLEETVSVLEPGSSFGEISVLCGIPQPYTVQVCELCRLLRVEKQTFTNVIEIYFSDGRKIYNNILEGKQAKYHMKEIESEITYHIGKQEDELTLKVNNAAYHGDLFQLKSLVRAGADPKKADYDGRTPLHLAASRGYEEVALFLIQIGVDVNALDSFGNTPLLEAIKNGYDGVVSLLCEAKATVNMADSGNFLCSAVARGDFDLLKRLLSNGVEPNCKDYDQRTPLHVATSRGLYLTAKLLIDAGASVSSKDRWGNTPLDEARMSGHKILINLLEDAKTDQVPQVKNQSDLMKDRSHPRKCTVYPSYPSESKEHKKHGVVLWVSSASVLLTEDEGQILETDLIENGQKFYLMSDVQ